MTPPTIREEAEELSLQRAIDDFRDEVVRAAREWRAIMRPGVRASMASMERAESSLAAAVDAPACARGREAVSEPVSRFIMEGDAEYGVFLERPHLRWWCEEPGAETGWHSARPGDLLMACVALQFAHEVARLQSIVDQDIGGALDRAEKAVLNRDAGYESGLAASRERVAALEGALREAIAHVTEYRNDCGPCDHAVGICVCGLDSDLERFGNVLTGAVLGEEAKDGEAGGG